MSMGDKQDIKPTWASKTNFDALGVESGEDTDEEDVEEPVTSPSPETFVFHYAIYYLKHNLPTHHSVPDPNKPSKSALKKAKAAARQEKRQQEKAARAAARLQAATNSAVTDAEESALSGTELPPSGSPSNPVPILDDSPSEVLPPKDVKIDTEPAKLIQEPNPPKISNGSVHAGGLAAEKSITSSLPSNSPPSTIVLQKTQPQGAYSPPVHADLKAAIGDIEATAESKIVATQDTEQQKKRQNALTRTLWTFIMIGGFLSECPTIDTCQVNLKSCLIR